MNINEREWLKRQFHEAIVEIVQPLIDREDYPTIEFFVELSSEGESWLDYVGAFSTTEDKREGHGDYSA